MNRFNIVLFVCLMLGIASTASAEMDTHDKSAPDNRKQKEQKEKKAASQQGSQEKKEDPPQQGGAPDPQREAPAVETAALFEQRGILTPRGKFVVEPSLQYAHSSSNRIAVVGYSVIPNVVVGVIDIRDVEDNTLVAALGVRYGITNRLEGEVKVPYVYRSDSSTTRSTENSTVTTNVFTADGNGIGDVDFGLRYQLNQPSSGAYYIAGIRVKSDTGKDPFDVPKDPETGLSTELPTGSGFWGIQPSLTAIYPSDPAVLFGSVSYQWNASRNVSGTGKVDPGDIIGFNFGMGFGLNERTSLSIGYDHSVVGRVKINGTVLEGTLVTQVGTLLVGYSFRYSEKTSFNLSLGAGLTEAAPDVQLTLRMPMNF